MLQCFNTTVVGPAVRTIADHILCAARTHVMVIRVDHLFVEPMMNRSLLASSVSALGIVVDQCKQAKRRPLYSLKSPMRVFASS